MLFLTGKKGGQPCIKMAQRAGSSTVLALPSERQASVGRTGFRRRTGPEKGFIAWDNRAQGNRGEGKAARLRIWPAFFPKPRLYAFPCNSRDAMGLVTAA